jgi:hypothetical protein
MRDGTVKTHQGFSDPGALFVEGPVDPQVAVLAARRPGGDLLGCLVNFACHPTHHGGGGTITAGYPGALARDLARRGCPVTLFLNGACGNIATSDCRTGRNLEMEETGTTLAGDAWRAIDGMEWTSSLPVQARSRTLQLPFRRFSDAETRGTIRGAQRFIDTRLYDAYMPRLLARIRERGAQPADVQVLSVGNISIAGIPAEYFVEHGLRIKESAFPRHALVTSCTNGMVGYVPTRAAFERGGYETTFGIPSWLAPEAGDMLADAAIELIRETDKKGDSCR